MNRLDNAFETLRSEGRKGLAPYVTAGYPDLETTQAILSQLDRPGVIGVEVGIPYSDPIADGPVIQASYSYALERGIRQDQIFEMVRKVRNTSNLPLLAMVSFSIVHKLGPEEYCESAAQAGFDGLIVPDLSLEERARIAPIAAKAGLSLVPLVAPTTHPQRRVEIARLATGFVYYLSVAGITGERNELPPELAQNVKDLREASGAPVCVGFGIHTADQVRAIAEVADGAIVGSAIIRRIAEGMEEGADREEIVRRVIAFVDELLAGLDPDGE
jgi:tryptophan synthase alpha chain